MQPDPRTQRHVQPPPGVPVQPPQWGPPPRKRRSNTGLIVGVVVLAVLLGIGALVVVVLAAVSQPTAHTVKFEVTTSSGQASLINWSTLEDSAIVNNAVSPWTHEVELESRTGIVGVNASTASGTVACKLWVDGKLVDEGESTGAVHCGATVR